MSAFSAIEPFAHVQHVEASMQQLRKSRPAKRHGFSHHVKLLAQWCGTVIAAFFAHTALADLRTDTTLPRVNAAANPANAATVATAATAPTAATVSASVTALAKPANTLVVLLLPSEQALLRRAALTVRDGVRAVAAKAGPSIELRDCAYGVEGANAAYRRCVNAEVSAVIGPLGRSEVANLLATPLELSRTTLMLSPSGVTPPESFYMLAPDLESEAERIAKQSLEDACLKPMIVDGGGPLAARVAVAMTAHFRASGAATVVRQAELGPRERWLRNSETWRKDGVDCVLFAGNGAQLTEFRPFLRNIVVYATSASYETELDRVVDWTGVRIADSPFVLDPARSDYALFAPAEPLSPTLARLYALGVDAARIVFDSALTRATLSKNDAPTAAAADGDALKLSSTFDGAIGRLQLQNNQYLRTPAVGEFRVRTPAMLSN